MKIAKLRKPTSFEPDPTIGCIILSDPIFFSKKDWIPMPRDWSMNIVSGKIYDTDSESGKLLWDRVLDLVVDHESKGEAVKSGAEYAISEPISPYYRRILSKVRIGQSAFRVLVTDAYSRRCCVTGERTLPTLEASHIKPYLGSGPNATNNGLLLRSDVHRLFDAGYVTVTSDFKIEVSKRIKEEYEKVKNTINITEEDYCCFQNLLLTVPPRIIWITITSACIRG